MFIRDVAQKGLEPFPLVYKSVQAVYRAVVRLYRFPKRKFTSVKGEYNAWFEPNQDFSGFQTDIKPIAFYLPQFHQTPENDKWWGKGFTEWTNTRAAKALFKGHYQPREPHDDIGYYDLTDINVLRKQAMLARHHGIHGFCFYHYWFSGKRMLEKPVDLLLQHPDIEIPFCLCWANAHWARTWDGSDTDILLKQEYSAEDPKNFIADLEKYLCDKRYIRMHGKPVLLVFRLPQIPDPQSTIAVWRLHCRQKGIGEIAVLAVLHDELDKSLDAQDLGVDGFVEFPPHCYGKDMLTYKKSRLFNYLLCNKPKAGYSLPPHSFRCVMLGWDNTARKGKKGIIFNNFSIIEYYKWLRKAIACTRSSFQKDDRFLFVNAWNEWAEGTYLEPDKKFGYVCLNTTSRAIFDLPFDYNKKDFLFLQSPTNGHRPPGPSKIAVHLHVSYPKRVDEVINYLRNLTMSFDLQITTSQAGIESMLAEKVRQLRLLNQVEIKRVPQHVGETGAWLIESACMNNRYDYICRLHMEETELAPELDSQWRTYRYESLLGGPAVVSGILRALQADAGPGFLFPAVPAVVAYNEGGKKRNLWPQNRRAVQDLLRRLNIGGTMEHDAPFPVPTMFWYRPESLKPLFELGLTYDNFPADNPIAGQNLSNALAASLLAIVKHQGFEAKRICTSFTMDGFSDDDTTGETESSKYHRDYIRLRDRIKSNEPISLTYIDSFVTESSRVLEFGPANGYLTRYLTEEKKARVDIVEISPEYAAEASRFACDCLVGDIEDYEWVDRFASNQYDYILFPDVLEHLRQPWQVLEKAATLLRQGGRVILSIPNVAHNAVVIGLCKGDFSYCKVGILDHTHIRFFTEETAKKMVEGAGFEIKEIRYTCNPDLSRMGIRYNLKDLPRLQRLFFKKRPNSDVVQFVMACEKKNGHA